MHSPEKRGAENAWNFPNKLPISAIVRGALESGWRAGTMRLGMVAALAVALEIVFRGADRRMAAEKGEALSLDELLGTRLPVEFEQLGLRVEQVELRGRADHVKINDALRAGREVRRPGCERVADARRGRSGE